MNPKVDAAAGALGLLVAALLWRIIPRQVMEGWAADGVGPRFFPYTMTAALAVFSAVLLVQAGLRWYGMVARKVPFPTQPVFQDLKRFAVACIALFAYYGLMAWLGFPVSTFVFLVGMMVYLGGRSWWQITLVALVADLAVFYVFQKTLGVVLPPGLVW